ncbi:MAG: hypothetical protein MK207_11215 [Saprospiraceae bacterium]|nr:hypothetical protein [Saprospiraceae bacterium]
MVEIIFVAVFIFFVLGFFRIFSSFSNMGTGIFKNVNKLIDLNIKKQEAELKGKQDYNCNNCHATVDDLSDISPKGDVKCKHCDSWFNVYQ